MQKRIFIFLFLLFTFLSYSTFAEAALQFLPRYQGGYGSRTQEGGKDKICSAVYQYTCSGTGYSGGSGTACGDKYQSCVCSANYKWSGGSCTLKTCADYGYLPSEDTTKSCEEKTPRSGLTCYVCTSCDSTTYKYSCSGGLNVTMQGTANKCGANYSECSCAEHSSWNALSGKCECDPDYKADSTSCTLKTCDDYSLLAANDTSKNCTKSNPRSGLECWNCSDCTGTLYDCGSITNASGGEGTACGGKYPSCSCKSLYRWDNGSCVLNCTRNSCSTTTYPLTAQNAANASSYEKCTPSCSDESPRYKVASCASGYNVNSNSSGCEAAPVKTCAEVLTEEGYTLIKSDYDFYKYTEWSANVPFQPLVLMNDIRAGIEFDSNGNEVTDSSCEHKLLGDLLTPEYFHSKYPQCSGTPTITAYNYIWVASNETNPEINVYPNINMLEGDNGSGWLYADYEGSIDSGKVIFHGNIDSEERQGISGTEPIVAEFRGNTVNSQMLGAWEVVLGSGTHFNVTEFAAYQVGKLTMEDGAKLSSKIQNNAMHFWYTVTSSGKTTYTGDDGYWVEVLPNGCSSGSGTVTVDGSNKGICVGKLSYMCETASSAYGKRNGSESETDLEYCRGKAVDCGTESCSAVANRSGKLVTDASQLSGGSNLNGYINLGKSITLSSDLNLDNVIIRNAADAFDECKCDNTIEKDPTLTVTGTVKVVSGSRPVGIETKANFTTVKNGGLTFSRNATIKTLNVSVGYWSGDPAYTNIRLANPITLKINEVQILAGEHADSSEHLNFYYEADNANVVIDKAICMWKEQSGGKAPCYINATYEMKSDGNGYANNGTIKYCPIRYGDVSSSEMAQNIWINSYNADEITGKSYYGYPSDSYPAATVTCSY